MMKPWTLRPDQEIAFGVLANRRCSIANMPTGWGKSFLLCCIAALDLLKKRRKVIICVPQCIIAKGFAEEKQIDLPGVGCVNWSVPKNLCDPTNEKVGQLVEFIRNPASGGPSQRIVLCTHMSLSHAFQQLSDAELATCFLHTTLFIDEAHHVQSSEEGMNQLGRIIEFLLGRNDRSTRLVLATAYFFRGDHLPIIDDKHLVKFRRHHVPFDDYWNSLRHVKTYSYEFVIYKGTVFRDLDLILAGESVPTIVYCPPEGHRMLLGKTKSRFVSRVRRLCLKHCSAELWRPGIAYDRKTKVVVDFVDESDRAEKVKFVSQNGDRVAVVLTVGMFREGADWVEAARIIDLVPTGSVQDRMQRFGRLVRDRRGKKHVSYFSFFQHLVEQKDEERRRELSKLYAHFHASLVLENAIKPIKVLVPRKKKVAENEEPDRLDLLGKLDEKTQESIIRTSYERLIRLQDDAANTGDVVTAAEAKTAVIGVLKEHNVSCSFDAMARQVILVMRRRANLRLNTGDLVDAGFDKVWEVEALDGLLKFSGGLGGPTTFTEIREAIDTVFENQWLESFAKMKALPQPPETHSNSYWWCTYNKGLHSQGKLSAERVGQLESICWWSWTERFEDRWNMKYQEVMALVACPNAKTENYSWVRQQRRQFERGKLSNEKINALEQIPWWKWSSNVNRWQAKYDRVSKLPDPPKRGTKDADWVRTQRKTYNDNRLLSDRIEKLELIRWWTWTARRSNRNEGLAILKMRLPQWAKSGVNKADARSAWSKEMGVGEDQIHKYVRKLPADLRELWKRLPHSISAPTAL